MKIVKLSSYAGKDKTDKESFIAALNRDLTNIFLAFQGMIRFGRGVTGERGENISGEWVDFTTHTTANYDFSVAHTLGSIPVGYIVISKDNIGDLYDGTGTNSTSTIYFRCTTTSTGYKVFLLK